MKGANPLSYGKTCLSEINLFDEQTPQIVKEIAVIIEDMRTKIREYEKIEFSPETLEYMRHPAFIDIMKERYPKGGVIDTRCLTGFLLTVEFVDAFLHHELAKNLTETQQIEISLTDSERLIMLEYEKYQKLGNGENESFPNKGLYDVLFELDMQSPYEYFLLPSKRYGLLDAQEQRHANTILIRNLIDASTISNAINMFPMNGYEFNNTEIPLDSAAQSAKETINKIFTTYGDTGLIENINIKGAQEIARQKGWQSVTVSRFMHYSMMKMPELQMEYVLELNESLSQIQPYVGRKNNPKAVGYIGKFTELLKHSN